MLTRDHIETIWVSKVGITDFFADVGLSTRTRVRPEFQQWLNENCKYYWARPTWGQIIFFREADALLYKLQWHKEISDYDDV